MTETMERPDLHLIDVNLEAFDEATKQLQVGSERMTDSWKAAGTAMINAYDGTMKALLDLQGIMIHTQLNWMSAFARAQELSARQVHMTQTRLMREPLG